MNLEEKNEKSLTTEYTVTEHATIDDAITAIADIPFKIGSVLTVQTDSGPTYKVLKETNDGTGIAGNGGFWCDAKQTVVDNCSYLNEAALKSDVNLKVGDVVWLLGKTQAGDGNSHLRKIVTASDTLDKVVLDNGLYAEVVPNSYGIDKQTVAEIQEKFFEKKTQVHDLNDVLKEVSIYNGTPVIDGGVLKINKGPTSFVSVYRTYCTKFMYNSVSGFNTLVGLSKDKNKAYLIHRSNRSLISIDLNSTDGSFITIASPVGVNMDGPGNKTLEYDDDFGMLKFTDNNGVVNSTGIKDILKSKGIIDYIPTLGIQSVNQIVINSMSVSFSTGGVLERIDYLEQKIANDSTDTNTSVGYDLVMFMGQSNMAGRGVSAESPVCPESAGREYRAVSNPANLVNIVEPFGSNENRGGITESSKTGSMVSSFVINYHKVSNRRVIAVSASKGGTSISQWQPDGGLLTEAISRLNETRAFCLGNNIQLNDIFMVWCQGCSDGDAGTPKDEYIIKFRKMLDEIKKHGVTKCMIVRIGNHRDDAEKYKPIMQAQNDICEYSDDTVLISTRFDSMAAESLMNDQFHYTQKGYNITGADAGSNAGLYMLTNKKPVLWDWTFGNQYIPKYGIPKV